MTNEADERALVERIRIPCISVDEALTYLRSWLAARAASPVSAPVTLDQAREWRRINWYDSVPEMLDKALAAFANYAAKGIEAPVSVASPSVASEDSATIRQQARKTSEPSPQVDVSSLHNGKTANDTLIAVEQTGTNSGSEDWMRKAADAVDEMKAARTAWHEDFGVPINMKYVRFLNAIGGLEEIAKHYAASKLSTEKK